MGRYRKVDTRVWNDSRFIQLDADSKLLFLFVLTHPHLTSLGAMRATIPGLAAELGWPPERFKSAFDEMAEHKLVDHDDLASFIGLPNFLKYNQPENPNVVTSWSSQLDLLPECAAKLRLLSRVQLCVEERGEKFVAAWESVSGTVHQTVSERLPEPSGKRFRKGSADSGADSGNGMPNPEPEQEHEPEQKPKQDPPPPASTASSKAGGDADRRKEVEGILGEAGLAAVVQTAADVIARDYSTDQLRGLTAELERRPNLGPGALAWRIRNVSPDAPLSGGWPAPPPKPKPAPEIDVGRYTSAYSRLKPEPRRELARKAGVDLTDLEGQGLRELPPAIQRPIVDTMARDVGDKPPPPEA